MNTGHVLYGSVLLLFVNLYDASCKGADRNAVTGKDTMILAGNKHSFKIDSDLTFFQAELNSTGKKVSGDKKLMLLFDDPAVFKDPDGVYEVYLSREKPDSKMLTSSHPEFINVLDIYARTNGSLSNSLTLDLNKKTGWAKDDQPLPSLFVTVIFRGNLLPGNIESKQAGQMTLKGIKVVQVEKGAD